MEWAFDRWGVGTGFCGLLGKAGLFGSCGTTAQQLALMLHSEKVLGLIPVWIWGFSVWSLHVLVMLA